MKIKIHIVQYEMCARPPKMIEFSNFVHDITEKYLHELLGEELCDALDMSELASSAILNFRKLEKEYKKMIEESPEDSKGFVENGNESGDNWALENAIHMSSHLFYNLYPLFRKWESIMQSITKGYIGDKDCYSIELLSNKYSTLFFKFVHQCHATV